MRRVRAAVVAAAVATVAASCSTPPGVGGPGPGGGASASTPPAGATGGSAGASPTTLSSPAPPTSATAGTVPAAAPHVMVVMMENKGFAQVVGQADQPYTNSLASRYGLATRSYAFGHPSLPNYLDLVSGSSQGVTDDGPPAVHSFPGVPTLADQLAAAGVREKAFAEDLPADPAATSGEYAVRHFPWEYFPTTEMPIAPATALVADLDSPDPPAFVWYTPNVVDDEHDGTVEQGDAFLARFVPAVQATAWYRAGGQIVIEWDESGSTAGGVDGTDGGHVPTIVVSAALEASPLRDPTPVDTAGILASIETCYGVGHLGAAADPASGTIGPMLRACGAPGG